MLKIDTDRHFGYDLVRAIAILIVLLGHGDLLLQNKFPNRPMFFIIDGVDLFFVLSGFLIGGIFIQTIERNDFGNSMFLEFWKKRWFRTLPNFYFMLLVTLIVTYFVYHNVWDYNTKYLLFSQALIGKHPDFMPVVWSLAVEEWFYLLLPIIYMIIKKYIPRITPQNVMLILIITIALVCLFMRMFRFYKLSIAQTNDSVLMDSFFRKSTFMRLDSIIYGVLGAYIKYYYFGYWKKNIWIFFTIGIIGILVYLYLRSQYSVFNFVYGYSILGISVISIFPAIDRIKKSPFKIGYFFTFISLISYSLYLIHFSIILVPLEKYFKNSSESIVLGIYFFYLLFSILLSTISYLYIEKPMLKLREKKYIF